MTYCITGASGFIGSHLVSRLRSLGHPVRVLLHRSQAAAEEGTLHVRGDLLDSASLQNFVEPGDTVINLAYLGSAPPANISAAKNLISVSRGRAARFIHLSTAAVFGGVGEVVVDEATIPRPIGEYQRVKYEIERMLQDAFAHEPILTIIRPTAVFGRGGRNLLKPARQLKYGSPIVNHLRRSLFGERRLNLVAVENVVEAIAHLASVRVDGGSVFIVSDDESPLNQYAAVSALLCSELHCRMLHAPPIPGLKKLLPPLLRVRRAWPYNPAQTFSSKKLQATGYCPSISFESALRNYAGWLHSTGAL